MTFYIVEGLLVQLCAHCTVAKTQHAIIYSYIYNYNYIYIHAIHQVPFQAYQRKTETFVGLVDPSSPDKSSPDCTYHFFRHVPNFWFSNQTVLTCGCSKFCWDPLVCWDPSIVGDNLFVGMNLKLPFTKPWVSQLKWHPIAMGIPQFFMPYFGEIWIFSSPASRLFGLQKVSLHYDLPVSTQLIMGISSEDLRVKSASASENHVLKRQTALMWLTFEGVWKKQNKYIPTCDG